MKVQEPIIKKVEYKDFFQNLEDCTNGVFESLKSDQQIILESQTIEECIFENCDLSNQRFIKKSFGRVIFRNCKLVGTTFFDCSLRDISFCDSLSKYINFSGCKMSSMIISNCDFSYATLEENVFHNIFVDHVNFSNAEFVKLNLKGIDFSSSDITNVLFERNMVEGMIINYSQSFELVKLLGIYIKEEEDFF